MVAVPKPGGDTSLPKGYRPVSLLSCLSKVLERIVTDRLAHVLERSSMLTDQQFGFRKTFCQCCEPRSPEPEEDNHARTRHTGSIR